LLGKEVVLREGRESATPVVLWATKVAEGEEGRGELEGKAPVVEDKLKEAEYRTLGQMERKFAQRRSRGPRLSNQSARLTSKKRTS